MSVSKKDGCGGGRKKPHSTKGGGIIFLNKDTGNSKIIDIVRQHDKFYIHQQIERRNGLLFMRLKKRALNTIHA